ncbi:exonuclease SbcCD subunit D [Vagococcus sp. BWB3-3]|uniref:Nuclease SbcCD subunit D n=1 Tax=Vagococcus allomyrinae TaxID=2794353 RepID=A0A940P1V5_9ENTE|nr:exonuclease SbcCD subunit D [Vagococcus allomyrinae]MBP1039937.1 exonuclease SbcCD subunit D [Vagococcus allomyrinae]
MKFIHTGDWHIGKKLNGFDLLEEQRYAFEQLMKLADLEQVDGIIIAGDLYDRSVPAVEAVELFNQMLIEMNLQAKYPVFAISGNHDSATRLETGGPWFEALNFHLHTRLEQAFTPVEFGNVQLYLLPYFEPFEARQYFKDDRIRTIEGAMASVIEEMRQSFQEDKQQVLVAHFFVAGSETSDSETKVTVGGLDVVPLSLLRDFDYVALGHLHYQRALTKGNARYSGSLLKYSTSEVNQPKGVWLVEVGAETVFDFVELPFLRDLQVLEGDFATLMAPSFYETIQRDNYLAISLTDRGVIPNVMTQLRTIYPQIIQLERAFGRDVKQASRNTTEAIQVTSPTALFANYFKETTGEPLSPRQREWLDDEISEIERGSQ